MKRGVVHFFGRNESLKLRVGRRWSKRLIREGLPGKKVRPEAKDIKGCEGGVCRGLGEHLLVGGVPGLLVQSLKGGVLHLPPLTAGEVLQGRRLPSGLDRLRLELSRADELQEKVVGKLAGGVGIFKGAGDSDVESFHFVFVWRRAKVGADIQGMKIGIYGRLCTKH